MQEFGRESESEQLFKHRAGERLSDVGTWGRSERSKPTKLPSILLLGFFLGFAVTLACTLLLGIPAVWMLPVCAVAIGFCAKVNLVTRLAATYPSTAEIVDSKNRDEYLVRIWVADENLVYGQDKGIVWFENGALWFNGEKCWFKIPRQDLTSPTEKPNSLSDLGEGMLVQLTGEEKLYLVFASRIGFRGTDAYLPDRKISDGFAIFIDHTENSDETLVAPPRCLDPNYHATLLERPISRGVIALLRNPLFSTRLWFLVTLALPVVAESIIKRDPIPAICIFSLAPVLYLSGSGKGRKLPSVAMTNQGLRAIESTNIPGIWNPISDPPSESYARRENRFRTILPGAIGIEFGAFLAGMLYDSPIQQHPGSFMAVAIALDLLLFAALRPIRQFASLRHDKNSESESTSVQMLVEVEGVIRGGDQGEFQILESGLQFKGTRCDFYIAKQDLIWKGAPVKNELSSLQMPCVLSVMSSNGRVRIGLKACKGESLSIVDLMRWRFESTDSSDPTVLPPLEFDSEYLRKPWYPFNPIAMRIVPCLAAAGFALWALPSPLSFVLPPMLIITFLSQEGWLLPGRYRGTYRRFLERRRRRI